METCNTLSALPLTMTSREIADLVEKRHDSVKRTIDTLVERGVIQLPQIVIAEKINGLGLIQKSENYVFTHEHKRDTFIVVAQLSPEFTAKLVDRWQELEAAAALTPHPDAYRLSYQPAIEIQIFESAIRELRVSETSKIRMYAAFCKSKDINSDFLPDYVNEPQVKAITSLLKDMSNPLYHHVAKLVNPALEAMGILERLSRKSTGTKIKHFWSLTEAGLQYGRNETSPNNPRETQPLFFVACFPELLMRLEAHRAGKLLPPAQ